MPTLISHHNTRIPSNIHLRVAPVISPVISPLIVLGNPLGISPRILSGIASVNPCEILLSTRPENLLGIHHQTHLELIFGYFLGFLPGFFPRFFQDSPRNSS